MALIVGGTAVDATAAEIDVLDGLDRGSIIYGNASSATTVLGQGNADEVLTSDGTDIAWAAAPAQYSTRYFYAHRDASNQSISADTATLVELDSAIQGGTGGFDTSTYFWTAGAADAGIWVFNGQISFYCSSNNMEYPWGMFYYNDALAAGGYAFVFTVEDHPALRHFVVNIQQIISISENDTVKLYAYAGSDNLYLFAGDPSGGYKQTSMMGHKI